MSSFHYIHIVHEADDQLIELLEENRIGTPEKSMVYKHHDVRTKVSGVPNPYFANLSIRNRLYGTICLSKRTVYNCGIASEAFYLRYFTFRESTRAQNPKDRNKRKSSLVREDVKKLMDGKGLDFHDPLFLYAYVDQSNIRSKRLIDEFGFKKISDFQVIPFSRLWTRNNNSVKVAAKTDFENIRNILIETYQFEQLVSFENLFKNGRYFYIIENGKLVCGAQAIPDQWEVLELPGASGKILLNIIPRIPFIKRLFDPKYKFVFLESVFCRDGHERKLQILFESILSYHNLYSAIICLDRKSKLYSQVKQNNMGLTHKLQGEKTIDVVVKTSHTHLISDSIPTSVSGYDVL